MAIGRVFDPAGCIGVVLVSKRKVARRDRTGLTAKEPNDLLAGYLEVTASLRRDYPGWDEYNAALDAAATIPDQEVSRAERDGIRYAYSASVAREERSHWWRDHPAPDWYSQLVSMPEPESEVAPPAAAEPLGPMTLAYVKKRSRRVQPVPTPDTWRDHVASWAPAVLIIGGVLIWAVILDSLFGLENLRRLLGWTLY